MSSRDLGAERPPVSIRTIESRVQPKPANVRQALATVPLTESPQQVAQACVDALDGIVEPAALYVPGDPMPVEAGVPRSDLELLVRFPGMDGEGELWGETGCIDLETQDELTMQLARIWAVQRQRASANREVDQLKFHLAALQQVTHTLAVVRKVEETEQLVVDSTKEVFFAWWAALYRTDDSGRYLRRVGRAMRGEAFPKQIPNDVLRSVLPAKAPAVPAADAAIRKHLPADVGALAPLDLGDGSAGLIVLGARMTDAAYEPPDLALLRALADASAIALRNSDLLERLRTQAVRDPLTGCQNRRGFDDALLNEIMRSRRYRRALSLVVLDIDHFKSVNDTFGHDTGDHALRIVGQTLSQLYRVTDTVARIGGEEFALIFPESEKDDSLMLAERARLAIAALPVNDLLPRQLTVSLGVAGYPEDGSSPAALLRAADRALYRAKARGRNRSELAHEADRMTPSESEEAE